MENQMRHNSFLRKTSLRPPLRKRPSFFHTMPKAFFVLLLSSIVLSEGRAMEDPWRIFKKQYIDARNASFQKVRENIQISISFRDLVLLPLQDEKATQEDINRLILKGKTFFADFYREKQEKERRQKFKALEQSEQNTIILEGKRSISTFATKGMELFIKTEKDSFKKALENTGLNFLFIDYFSDYAQGIRTSRQDLNLSGLNFNTSTISQSFITNPDINNSTEQQNLSNTSMDQDRLSAVTEVTNSSKATTVVGIPKEEEPKKDYSQINLETDRNREKILKLADELDQQKNNTSAEIDRLESKLSELKKQSDREVFALVQKNKELQNKVSVLEEEISDVRFPEVYIPQENSQVEEKLKRITSPQKASLSEVNKRSPQSSPSKLGVLNVTNFSPVKVNPDIEELIKKYASPQKATSEVPNLKILSTPPRRTPEQTIGGLSTIQRQEELTVNNGNTSRILSPKNTKENETVKRLFMDDTSQGREKFSKPNSSANPSFISSTIENASEENPKDPFKNMIDKKRKEQIIRTEKNNKKIDDAACGSGKGCNII